MPAERKQVDFGPLMPSHVLLENPSRDYTPPSMSLLPTAPRSVADICVMTGADRQLQLNACKMVQILLMHAQEIALDACMSTCRLPKIADNFHQP